MSAKLAVLKLISGEEIIGRVTNDRFSEVGSNSKLIALQDVFSFKQETDEEGKTSIEFNPWASMISGDVIIPYTHIIYSAEPIQKMKNAYFSAIQSQPGKDSVEKDNQPQTINKLKEIAAKAKKPKQG